MAYIHFENVNKFYGTNHVLKDISLDVEQGQLITFLGPSGCGKSTLLRCLSGLEQVSSGKIFLDGKDVTEVDPRRRGCGMVFQQYSLFPNLTVRQNVAFGLKMKKTPKAETEKKVKEMLESRVDLETAVSRGDTASLIGAVSSALKSAEGQRLAESLRELMKK